MEPFSPIEATPEAVENAEEAVAGRASRNRRSSERNLHPDELGPERDQPGRQLGVGGDNWPPSSYDPEKNMYFVCSQSRRARPRRPAQGTAEVQRRRNVHRLRTPWSRRASTPKASSPPTTCRPAKIAWQNNSRESCYSGAVTTAGGLVFVGQNNGELRRLRHRKPAKNSGASRPAPAPTRRSTPFEDEGEEKIAIYAGGNSLAATSHGENFWVFSLKGTMGPEKGTENEAEGTDPRRRGIRRRNRKKRGEEAGKPKKPKRNRETEGSRRRQRRSRCRWRHRRCRGGRRSLLRTVLRLPRRDRPRR